MTDAGFHYQEIGPPPELAGHIRCLWRLRGAAITGARAEPIVPDGCVELVLNFGDPFIRHPRNGTAHTQPRRLVTGQLTQAIAIAPSGRIDLWGIRFHPWTAPAFLDVAGSDLRDRMVTLGDASRALDTAIEPVFDAVTEHDQRSALLTALADHARRTSAVDPVLPALISLIGRQGDVSSVRELARHAGLGTRRLQALFADRVGMSPKMLMRLNRFQRALRIAREHPTRSWSTVSVEAGYYDQPHLNHDCQEIAGCAPSSLVARDARLTELFLES